MKLYSLEAVEGLKEQYYESGGQVVTIKEGALLDDLIMFGNGLKTAVIVNRYLNAWSSAYTVRFYNKVPKKYETLLQNI